MSFLLLLWECNIEIRRVVTHIYNNEEQFLLEREETRKTNPELAHQIRLHRWSKFRFSNIHMQRFKKLAKDLRFTETFDGVYALFRSEGRLVYRTLDSLVIPYFRYILAMDSNKRGGTQSIYNIVNCVYRHLCASTRYYMRIGTIRAATCAIHSRGTGPASGRAEWTAANVGCTCRNDFLQRCAFRGVCRVGWTP